MILTTAVHRYAMHLSCNTAEVMKTYVNHQCHISLRSLKHYGIEKVYASKPKSSTYLSSNILPELLNAGHPSDPLHEIH